MSAGRSRFSPKLRDMLESGRVTLMCAILVLVNSASYAADIQVGFYSSHSNVAANSSSVSINLTFPTTTQCEYPALALRVAIRNATAALAPIVDNATWTVGSDTQHLFSLTGDWNSSNQNNRKRSEIWILTGPNPGSGTLTANLNGAADVIAEGVVACAVNQSNPALPGATSRANTSATNNPKNGVPSTRGGLYIDVLALDDPRAVTSLIPSRAVDMTAVSVPAGTPTLVSYSSHYTETTTTGFTFPLPEWTLDGDDYWVYSQVVLQPFAPTLVELSDLVAEQTPHGVLLSWRTGLEVDNLGFRIYREDRGERIPLTPGIIAGSAINFPNRPLEAGYSYAWLDRSGTPGTRYLLESIELSGAKDWHGPVEVEHGQRMQLREASSPLLGDLGAPGFLPNAAAAKSLRHVTDRVIPDPVANPARQRRLAAGEAVKLAVREPGLYRVTFDELAALGFDVSRFNFRNLQLFNNGSEQAIAVTSDAVEFYGVGADDPYTDTRVYWLTKGNSPGRRIPLRDFTGGREQDLATAPLTVQHRERFFYVMGITNGEQENFWGRVIGASGVTQAIPVSQLDSAASFLPTFEVEVQGLGVPHTLVVELNGTTIGELVLDAWDWRSARFTVPLGALVDGDNTFTLKTTDAEAYALFDTVRLTYPRRSVVHEDALTLAFDRRDVGHGVRFSGFSRPDIRAFDVTNPSWPIEISGRIVADGPEFAINVPGQSRGAGRLVLATFTSDHIKAPVTMTLNRPSSWFDEEAGADMVIVAPRAFEDVLAPLVALRQSQGLSVVVVDIEDIFDELNFGMKSPHAIRRFMEMAQQWKTQPRFLLLAGNGTFDPRDYLGAGGDLVPTMHVNTEDMEVPSDDWFTDIDGTGVPAVATGRLPAGSVAEMEGIVAKILARDGSLGSLARGIVVSDEAIGSNFEMMNDEIIPLIPVTGTLEEVTVRELGTAGVRQAVLAAINDGIELVHFAGHGSVDHWRSGMLTSSDAATLTNAGHGTLFTVMNCLNGRFDDPLSGSLAKALVNAANGGAIAVWSSAGTTTAPDQTLLMTSFFSSLAETQSTTLGEAARTAKAAVSELDVRRTWVLLGDPASAVE